MEKVKELMGKLINLVTKDRKNTLIALIAGVLVLSLLMTLVFTPSYRSLFNTYKKAANAKTADKALSLTLEADNGFCEKEVRKLIKLLGKTDLYDNLEEDLEESIAAQKEFYGKNYKFRYKLVEKDKMNADQLNAFRESLDSLSERCEKTAENLVDPENQWEDYVEDLDLSSKEAKKAADLYKKLAKKLANAKVTAGYILELDCKVTGRNLDEAEEFSTYLHVYKINGKWTCNSATSLLRTLA